MNGNEIGLLIVLIILLLICFFIIGYMYATIRMRKIFCKMVKPNNVSIKRIDVKNHEDFEKMMKNLFDEVEKSERDDKDDDTRSND